MPCSTNTPTPLDELSTTCCSISKGKTRMARLVSTLKYARYAMGSLTAVLFAACAGGS